MPKHQKSRSEIQQALSEERLALGSSLAAFDSGVAWEIKRVATSIENICSDKGKTRSLLSQLCLKDAKKVRSSAQREFDERAPHALLLLNLTKRKFVPVCTPGCFDGNFPPWAHDLSLREWWNQPVFLSKSGAKLTRSQLVAAVRNQDGGAHHDEFLTDQRYVDLKYDHGSGISRSLKDLHSPESPEGWAELVKGLGDISGARDATLRQIAFELQYFLWTLQQENLITAL